MGPFLPPPRYPDTQVRAGQTVGMESAVPRFLGTYLPYYPWYDIVPFSLTFFVPPVPRLASNPAIFLIGAHWPVASQPADHDIPRINGLLDGWDGSARSIWPLVLCMCVQCTLHLACLT